MYKIPVHKLLWVSLFGIAFAFVEASIVVYLRALYYPEGFSFPLKVVSQEHLAVELAREAATIIILVTVGIIAGRKRWEKFGYFLAAFGIWDIFYYVWLKVALNWPQTLTDWDVLFLIPVPWVGPVIAPLLLALLMTCCGVAMVVRLERGLRFQPTLLSWSLSLMATMVALYSFMYDCRETLQGKLPSSYPYKLLVVSLGLYLAGFLTACSVRGYPGGRELSTGP